MRIRVFKRQGDGKVFHKRIQGHWTEIIADDGETDVVKWYGGDKTPLYVSCSNGHSYELHDADPT